MASAVTRLSDVIVPDVDGRYLTEASIYKNLFYRSGIMTTSSEISGYLRGGGTVIDIPHWIRDETEPQVLNSNTTIETRKLTTSKQAFRRYAFANAWSSEELASMLAGDDANAAIRGTVDDYWNLFYNKMCFSTVKGIMADNIDNDSLSLVNDITTSGTPTSSNKISTSAVVDTKVKLGDRIDDFVAVAMHSTVYATLEKNNAIATVVPSGTTFPINFYGKLRVIVDDGLWYDTDGSNREYWTIFFKAGSMQYGESTARMTPMELDRDAEKSEDRLFTRRQFAIHPVGYRWLETSVAGDMPSRSEIEESGNWDRVWNIKNTGICVLISNG